MIDKEIKTEVEKAFLEASGKTMDDFIEELRTKSLVKFLSKSIGKEEAERIYDAVVAILARDYGYSKCRAKNLINLYINEL